MERTASLLAAAALAGAGGAAMTGVGGMEPPAKIGAGQVPVSAPATVEPARPSAPRASDRLPQRAADQLTAPGRRGSKTPSKARRGDRFAPDRAGQREDAPAPPAGTVPPSADSPAASGSQGVPTGPHALGVPDPGALVEQVTQQAGSAVQQTTAGGLNAVRDSTQQTQALLGTVNRQATTVVGETGKGLRTLVDR